MLATITTGRIDPTRRQQTLAIFREILVLDEQEPGTLIHAFHTDHDDPGRLWVYELWQSMEALEEHRRNQVAVRQRLAPLVPVPFELYYCDPLFAKGVDFGGP